MLVVALAGASGCILFDLSKVSVSEKAAARFDHVAGTVESDSTGNPWMVVYAAKVPCDEDWTELLALMARSRAGEVVDMQSAENAALVDRQEFTALIESLDRERFQPWVFFYPSGTRLDAVSEFLTQTVMNLQLRHGFDDLVVVAHSMGGLVSRDFILQYRNAVTDFPVRLFVSLSTPWGGVPSAASGVRSSPFVVPSWRDVAPDSDFLAGLFFEGPVEQGIRKPLPEEVSFYLLFGVADQTIPLSSAIRWQAARDARARWPLPYDHAGVLRSPEAAELLGEILATEYR